MTRKQRDQGAVTGERISSQRGRISIGRKGAILQTKGFLGKETKIGAQV